MKGGYQHLRAFLTRPLGRDGFSIVEVMIVLAVSGGLFVAITMMLSGRQAQAQFNQAITSVKHEIEQVINEVQSGYSLASDSPYSCTVNGSGVPQIASGGSGQGTSTACIFLGKALQFSTNAEFDESYATYVIVGNRTAANFAASNPRTSTLLMETKPLRFGLRTEFVRNGVGQVGGVAFTTPFSQSGTVSQGSNSVELRPVGTSTNLTSNQFVSAVGLPAFASAAPNPAGGIQICLRSGTTNQSGLITVGAGNSPASVQLDIRATGDCT